jgi:hypothetical protein
MSSPQRGSYQRAGRATSAGAATGSAAEWERLIAPLGPDLESGARATGAFRRRRRVGSAEGLLRLVLAYCAAGMSLRLTAAWAEAAGVAKLSESALRQRFRRAGSWLGELVAGLVGAAAPGRAGQVRLIDATVVSAPGSRGADWRVHLSWDLAGRVAGVELTDARRGETLTRHAAAPGAIAVADGGYSHQRGLGEWLAAGRHAVVRYAWQTLPLYGPAAPDPLGGEALDAWLATVPPDRPAERPAEVRSPAGTFRVRLVAARLSQEAADRARQKLRRQAQKKGRTPSERSLRAAGYLILVTSLPAADWPAAAVLDLYRLRWQVELAFKRLKGLWELDAARARGPLGSLYLLGTLLQALLAAAALRPPAPAQAWFAAADRPLSPWRCEALARLAARQAILGPVSLAHLRAALPGLRRHLCDSPRRRPQQAARARRLAAALPGALAPPRAA